MPASESRVKKKAVNVSTFNSTNESRGTSESRPRARTTIREATLADYGQIAALQIRNGLAVRSRHEWIDLWRDNPARQQTDRAWPIGWVLETSDGEIVGSIGNIPLMYQFRGRQLRAATAYGWVVDARYRAYSTWILSRLLKQEAVDLFVFSTVNSNAEPVYSAFGFLRVPVGTWHKSGFWITNYRGFALSALRKRSVPLARVISYPASGALFCVDAYRHANMPFGKSDCEIQQCLDFDSRFDRFWEELKQQNEEVLLAVRARETLVWHFRRAMSQQSTYILAASEGSRLVAYAIFERQDNPALGLKRVRLVDFQALHGSEEVLRSVVYWMLQECRRAGIHILEVMGCWLDRIKSPRILVPHHRTLPSWAYYYKANDKDLGEALQDPQVWAPSSYDGDASL